MALPVLNSAKYTVVIPSTGTEIEYRPYTVKEEKILMIALESKDQKMVLRSLKDVISNCVTQEVELDDFTLFDFETIFLALRAKSVGEVVDLQLKCDDEKCSGVTPVAVNLEQIKLTEMPESRTIFIDKKVGIIFKYPSISIVEQYDQENAMENAFDMIVSCIDEIFDEDNVYDAKNETKESLTTFVESLSTQQFAKVSDFFSKVPTLAHDVEFKCITCGKENKIELKGLQSFFT
jgi:hypothetical protein